VSTSDIVDDGPVLDANGQEVALPPGFEVSSLFRQFMAGRVRAAGCPHYMLATDVRIGWTTCERCPNGAGGEKASR
jgi:hypothetical protein